jgi:hypothetical protein
MKIEDAIRDLLRDQAEKMGPTRDALPGILRRISESEPRVSNASRRAIAAVVAFAVFAAAGIVLWQAFHPSTAPRPLGVAEDPWASLGAGWTELPAPPQVREEDAHAWTGQELVSWGGHEQTSDAPSLADGFIFDPSTMAWSSMPAAPIARSGASAVWTGSEVLFWGGWDSVSGRLAADGAAFDPATLRWRLIPAAPLDPRAPAAVVWTGSEMIVWGGGPGSDRSETFTDGAAYDPIEDTWHAISRAPIVLDLASGVWAGNEMIVFGSNLNNRNIADTATSVGEAYDPATDTWLSTAPSSLSPQATSAVWVGDRMLAWDYDLHAQEYSPQTDSWSDPETMPMEPSECYPDSAVVGDVVFAWYCGEAATWDPGSGDWQRVRGGPLEAMIQANGNTYQLWRFADLVAAGDVLLLPAEGITVDKGEPCYGCSDSPHSFWAYRPPEIPSGITPSSSSDVVFSAPFFSGGEGWYERDSGPVREENAAVAWASTTPLSHDDLSYTAIPPATISALPPDGIVVTAEIAPWGFDPSGPPYPPGGLDRLDLSSGTERPPEAEEPTGDYSVIEIDNPYVLVRVYFGVADPSAELIGRAQAELDTLQVPPVCPVPAKGPYPIVLSAEEGAAGTTVTISGLMPFRFKDGSFDHSGDNAAIAWWNASASDWPALSSSSTALPSPASPGPLIRLGESGHGTCSFEITFVVPDVPAGDYPIQVLEDDGEGSALWASFRFTVTG